MIRGGSGLALFATAAVLASKVSTAATTSPAPAWIGVVSEQARSCDGAHVTRVLLRSPAERAGLRVDDCLSGVGDRAVRSPRELRIALDSLVAGGPPITIRLWRGGHPEEISVSPSPRPSATELQRAQLLGRTAPSLDRVSWVAHDSLATPKATVIAFGAEWCGPCRMAEPSLMRVHNRFRAQGVRLIQMRQDDRESASAFAAKEAPGIMVGADERGELAAQFFVFSLPTFVILDKEGRVSEIVVGYNDALESRLTSELSRVLSTR